MSLASKFGAGNSAELTAPSKNDFSRPSEGTIAPRSLAYHFGSGGLPPGTFSPSFLAATTALFTPLLIPGAVAVALSLLTNATTLFAPAMSVEAPAGAWYDTDPQYDLMTAGADLNNDRYFLPDYGPDIVTGDNKTFDSAGNWALGTGWAVSNGQLVGTSVANFGGCNLGMNGLFTPGKTYELEYTTTITAGRITVYGAPGLTAINQTVSGTYKIPFTATGTSGTLRVEVSNGPSTVTVDNLRIREVLLDRTGKTLGPDLITGDSSTFTSSAGSWYQGTSAGTPQGTVTAASGVLTVTNGTNGFDRAQLALTSLDTTSDYELTFVITSTNSGARINLGTAADGTGAGQIGTFSAAGAYTVKFKPTATTMYLGLMNNDGTSGHATSWDNITLKKITAAGTKYPKRAATFDEFFAFTASGTTPYSAHTYIDQSGKIRPRYFGTNQVRNTLFDGTVTGTPGTLPTNMGQVLGTGLTREILATGTSAEGIPYVDIRFSGTPSTIGVLVGYSDWMNIVSGEQYVSSLYLQLIAGTLPAQVRFQHDNQGGASTPSPPSFTPSTTEFTRYSHAHTAGAAQTAATFWLNISLTNGVATDFTIRVGGFQYEAGTVPTGLKKTTSAQTNGVNLPRFDWRNGKRQFRIEPQRTNFVLQSNDLTQAAWTNSGPVTLAAQSDPHFPGMFLHTETTGGIVYNSTGITVTSGKIYTYSRVLKKGNYDWAQLCLSSAASFAPILRAWFNLATGVKGTTPANGSTAFFGTTITTDMIDLGGGYYRCSVTFTAASTGVAFLTVVSASTDQSTARSTFPASVYMAMPQFEEGSYATDYIPTTTGTVTRAIEGSQLSDLIAAIVTRGTFSIVTRGQGQITSSSPMGANAVIFGGTSGGTALLRTNFQANLSGQTAASGVFYTTSPYPPHGEAASYGPTRQAVSANGSTPVSAATGYVAQTAPFLFGRMSNGQETFSPFGFWDFIGISPEEVNDNQLQTWAVAAS